MKVPGIFGATGNSGEVTGGVPHHRIAFQPQAGVPPPLLTQ